MIDEAGEARRLLAVLRERPLSVDPAGTEARRLRALPRLERHVRHAAERRKNAGRRRVAFSWLAAAFALVVAGLGIREFRRHAAPPGGVAVRAVEGHLVHSVSGASYAVSAGDRLTLPVEGELQTDARSRATLETEQGLRLEVEEGSRLALSGMSRTGSDRSVELQDGQIQCAVPKLRGGERFSVVTPNARVVVHGTRFTVRVDSREVGVTRTCVRVSEGVVAVHHGAVVATLLPGDEWGCGTDERTAGAERASRSAPSPGVVRGNGRAAPVHRSERSSGTLAEETALLQTALAAERKGQPEAAAAALTRLFSHFPDSQLTPEARAVQKRVSREPSGSP